MTKQQKIDDNSLEWLRLSIISNSSSSSSISSRCTSCNCSSDLHHITYRHKNKSLDIIDRYRYIHLFEKMNLYSWIEEVNYLKACILMRVVERESLLIERGKMRNRMWRWIWILKYIDLYGFQTKSIKVINFLFGLRFPVYAPHCSYGIVHCIFVLS